MRQLCLWKYTLILLGCALTGLPAAQAESVQAPAEQHLALIELQTEAEIEAQAELTKAWAAAPPQKLPPLPLPDKDGEPIHIIFCFVDHWEPGYESPHNLDLARMWRDDYGAMAARHRDADGRKPQHSWFCAYLDFPQLHIISEACYAGLGEMEIHIHHGTADDTIRDNTQEISTALDLYLQTLNRVGACRTTATQPVSTFAYIHGLWALDNSRLISDKRQWCGVNREIDLLIAKKCYADFTFPAWGTMTPNVMLDKIFYSRDSLDPKSYDNPALVREATAGSAPPDEHEFMIFEGPNDNTNIDQVAAPSLWRMNRWVQHNVHVPGRDNWIFVKVYTHSAQSINAGGFTNLVGATMDQFYTDIERVYNDGVNYQLHYATARELYNMARAAQDGQSGSPNLYRDYLIPPPANCKISCNKQYQLLSYDREKKQCLIELEEDTTETLHLAMHDCEAGEDVLESSTMEKSGFCATNAAIKQDGQVDLEVVDSSPSRYYLVGPHLNPTAVDEKWMY